MNKGDLNLKVSTGLKRNQDVTFLIVSLLISGIFLYLVVAPIYEKRAEIENDNLTKQEDLEGKQGLLSGIESFNKNNKSLSVNSNKLVYLIPNRNNFEDFFVHLRSISKSHNMELIDIELKEVSASSTEQTVGAVAMTESEIGDVGIDVEAETANQLNAQGISLSLRGSYSDFLGFIKALENGIAFLQEDSFQVKTAEKKSDSSGDSEGEEQTIETNPLLDFNLELRFIYY
ncbi:MAG: hypothetical protein WC178_01575 [Candidatus Paceibacterota bacterium]